MSNPTELPDLDDCPFCGSDHVALIHNTSSDHRYDWDFAVECECGAKGESDKSEEFAVKAWNRRAQPEGEAPQADAAVMVPKFEGQFDSHQDWVNRAQRVLSVPSHKPSAICVDAKGRRCHIGSDMRRASEEGAFPVRYFWECELATQAATLSPLCGAQHAESGKEVAAKPPFPISDDEMAALRRFWECATDGEGYDVEKSMMQRLAEMGLVQRKSGAYYVSTDFGLYVLGEYTVQRAAQLDGGQEGSESNG